MAEDSVFNKNLAANDAEKAGVTPTSTLPMAVTLHPRVLAHLGDAVYELMVREYVIDTLGDVQAEKVHRASIAMACAEFQVKLLEVLLPTLSEDEVALIKRARNASISVSRRNNPKLYRDATAFEALIGQWHLEQNTARLNAVQQHLRTSISG
jgi:ribonuclease III family protein